MRKIASSIALPLVGAGILLALAYACDALIETLRQQNSMTFSLTGVLFWASVATNLLVNGALLALFWAVITRTARSAWVGGLYLLAVIYLVASLGLYPLVANIFYPPTPGSFLFYALGGIGVIGLFVLVLPKVKQTTT
jgi:hypothetical protein